MAIGSMWETCFSAGIACRIAGGHSLCSRAMIIRDELPGDRTAIAQVTAAAFAGVRHSDQTEPAIVAGLRAAGVLALSLVAVDDGAVIGHVAFSPVTVAGRNCGWFGLGPISVLPERQGKGIGGALIWRGLARLRSQDAAGCVILGDPTYYRRFGFERDDRLLYDGAPPEYFMRLSLRGEPPSGRVDYHPAFSGG
jgi:putative acetyltransferase